MMGLPFFGVDMDISLETRICLTKNCDKTFRVMPTSKSQYCCFDCKFISGGKKKSIKEIKEFHGRMVFSAMKKPKEEL